MKKLILSALSANYTGFITFEFDKGFAICGAFGGIGDVGYKKVCYDENSNRATQNEVD